MNQTNFLRRSILSLGPLAILAIACGLTGCGPAWSVVQQSGPPSALRGASAITFTFDTSEVVVDGTPIGTFGQRDRTRMEAAFAEVTGAMLSNLARGARVPVSMAVGDPQPGEVRLVAVATDLVRGAHGPYGVPTQLTVRYDWSVGGELVDSVEVTRSVPPAGLGNVEMMRVAPRMRVAGEDHGAVAADFFRHEQSR